MSSCIYIKLKLRGSRLINVTIRIYRNLGRMFVYSCAAVAIKSLLAGHGCPPSWTECWISEECCAIRVPSRATSSSGGALVHLNVTSITPGPGPRSRKRLFNGPMVISLNKAGDQDLGDHRITSMMDLSIRDL